MSYLVREAVSAVARFFFLESILTLNSEMPFFSSCYTTLFFWIIPWFILHIISCLFFFWDPASGWVVICFLFFIYIYIYYVCGSALRLRLFPACILLNHFQFLATILL